MDPNLNESTPGIEIKLAKLTAKTLSTRVRFGYVSLLIAALLMCITIISLLATELALPMRTRVAFSIMLLMSMSWASYAIWVLKKRHTLLVNHQLVASRMALTFTAIFTLGATYMGVMSGESAPYLAASMGGAMFVIAIGLLNSARRKFNQLQIRRQQIESEIAGEKK